MAHVTEEEVGKVINTLKNHTSQGIDKLTSTTIKKTKNNIIKPLTYIINTMIETAVFPDPLKYAVITPVHKGGAKEDPNNYRPISVLPVLSKIFERIILDKINNFFNKYRSISEHQFGFRIGKGVDDAISKLSKEVYESLNNKKCCLTVFLDLKKAFDVIPHDLLIKKLEKLGIRGKAGELIKSYLKNRLQRTKIQNDNQNGGLTNDYQLSSPTVVKYGVPQGSILGPLLFIAYINDLLKLNIDGTICSYADDTQLTFQAKNRHELFAKANKGFKVIREWMLDNMLTLNLDKTNYIDFSRKRTIDTFKIDDIERKDRVKYLGVTFDDKLNWKYHIEFACNKLRKTIHKFLQLRNIADISLMKTIYHAIFHSILKFGILAWGSAFSNQLDRLKTIQKRVLKIMYKKPRVFPTADIYKLAQVDDIWQIYVKEALIQTHKTRHSHNTVDHEHNTRYTADTEQLAIPHSNSTQFNRTALYVGIKYYNRLPREIREIMSIRIFRKKIISFLDVNV